MRYKGKRVRIKEYKIFTDDQLIKVVEGICIQSHQGRGAFDTGYYTILDDKGEEYTFGYNNENFSIEIIKKMSKRFNKER